MAVRYKNDIVSGIYFITFTVLDWKHVFIADKYCQLVFKWLDYMRDRYSNDVHGYVIMPNHVHILLYVSEQSPPVFKLIQNAKRFLAYQIIALLKEDNEVELLNHFKQWAEVSKGAKHKLFEPRYDSLLIGTEKVFLQKLAYIHNNPCQPKWNLAAQPEGYRYSSASNYSTGKGSYDVVTTW